MFRAAIFDLDGTLLHHHRRGTDAMRDAGAQLFGDHFTMDGVDYAGRLDGAIWRQAAAINAEPSGA